MITPILRLVLIYVVLIAAVMAVFNRDRLAGMFGGDTPEPTAAPAPAAYTPVAPEHQPAAPVTQPPAGQQPVYGSDLETPFAAPQAQTQPQSPGAVQAPAMADDAIAAAINTARAAFWRGDVEGARAQMLALSQANPNNAELLGELGNLQFSLRDFPAAADSWYRAGLLLIDQNGAPQNRGFMQALGMIDPEKAADLAARAQGR